MRRSTAEIHSRVHLLPQLRFESQQLTSFAGLILFQSLFQRMNLKRRIRECFAQGAVAHLFGHTVVFLLLVVQILMGYRRLRDRDYFEDDPMVQRILGVRHIPDTSTISRHLKETNPENIRKVRTMNREMVLTRMVAERLPRVTLDFDGSVQSTRAQAEGTAVGYNKKKKGARSYYPLFCTVAQTSSFLDVHHRSGNVHDSNGAKDFIRERVLEVRRRLPDAVIEARLDSAFFSDEIVSELASLKTEFSISVPFERFAELKSMIADRPRWHRINTQWSYFETEWKPKVWDDRFRFIFIRQKTKQQQKGPIQLDLFIPKDEGVDYKVIITNQTCSAKKVLRFHNGRGAQEGLFAEGKTHAQLDYIPTRNLCGNQLYTLAGMMAHNLSRELQMDASDRDRGTGEKRPPLWSFESLGSIRHRLIQRAGRMTRPGGTLTMTMNLNAAVQKDILHYLAPQRREKNAA